MPSAEFITMKVARFITIPVTTKVVRAVAWVKESQPPSHINYHVRNEKCYFTTYTKPLSLNLLRVETEKLPPANFYL